MIGQLRVWLDGSVSVRVTKSAPDIVGGQTCEKHLYLWSGDPRSASARWVGFVVDHGWYFAEKHSRGI